MEVIKFYNRNLNFYINDKHTEIKFAVTQSLIKKVVQ